MMKRIGAGGGEEERTGVTRSRGRRIILTVVPDKE